MADSDMTDPGWYLRKPRTSNEQWEWDGEDWTGRHRPPRVPKPESSPAFLIWLGVTVGAIGAVVLWVAAESSDDASWLPLALTALTVASTLVALLGIISAGVRHGTQWTDFDRQSRE